MRRTTFTTIAAAALLLTPVCAIGFAQPASTPRGTYQRPVDARALTWQRLMTRITVKFEGNSLEDVMRFISDFSGADLEPLWEDSRRSGLDRETEISIEVTDATVLSLLERVLEQVQDDFDANTWQFSRGGALEMGPKSRLNRKATLKVYDVNDLLYEIPNFPDVPALDLDQILNQSRQGGGGGGGSIFSTEDVDDSDALDKDELIQQLEDLITSSIETDQWASTGGDGATIRAYEGHLLIRAPDYIHRQIVGYPFSTRQSAAPARRATRSE